MPDHQEPLIPDAGGIWRRYLDHGAINHPAWLRARAEHAPVGTCRHCAAHLLPEAPHDRGGGRIDYEAQCTNPQCASVLLAPGGRIFRGNTTAWSVTNGAARAAALHRAAKEASSP